VGTGWKLTVSDNGVGAGDNSTPLRSLKPGFGTSIVNALAQQLDASVDFSADPGGTTVTITCAGQAIQ